MNGLTAGRRDARLLIVDAAGALHHALRADLPERLRPGDLVIANDAATIPASLRGVHVPSREPIEVRLAGRRSLTTDDVREFVAVAFGAGDHRTRTEDRLPPPPLVARDTLALGSLRATVTHLLDHPRLLGIAFAGTPDTIWAGIARHGAPIQYAHVDRRLALRDVWTRVAAVPVAFEAPSASFALDWTMLARLAARGIGFATVTLAAGLSSTGDPALDSRLPLDEAYDVPESTVRAVERARARGGRVVAVGTTVTRALEHAASRGTLVPGPGVATGRIGRHTELRVVDALVTGLHEPGTTHHEVLRAFAPETVLRRVTAVLERDGYRAHEFGDSLLLEQSPRSGAPGKLFTQFAVTVLSGVTDKSSRDWRNNRICSELSTYGM